MAQESTLRILSYNIYHGENPNVPGEPNLDSIAQLIIEINPDVVALQEVDSMTERTARIYGKKLNLIEELAKKTGLEGYFSKAMDYSEGGYGEGLLVKKSDEFLSQKLPIPAGGEPRAAAWALSDFEGKSIWIGGTHLCHQFQENRIAQVQALQKFALEKSHPIIWLGDLNFSPEDKEYKYINAAFLDAAFMSQDNSPTYQSTPHEGRIDYVWYTGDDFELIHYEVIPVFYSDHFPVLVELKLKN
ncbi:MAG: endonuclease/exonuclease/phosphatase family protein [Algoriphagus sp.]|nr:endonuclease/exonuclease/phosphatase family protein [Algoriphagus sp.]